MEKPYLPFFPFVLGLFSPFRVFQKNNVISLIIESLPSPHPFSYQQNAAPPLSNTHYHPFSPPPPPPPPPYSKLVVVVAKCCCFFAMSFVATRVLTLGMAVNRNLECVGVQICGPVGFLTLYRRRPSRVKISNLPSPVQ